MWPQLSILNVWNVFMTRGFLSTDREYSLYWCRHIDFMADLLQAQEQTKQGNAQITHNYKMPVTLSLYNIQPVQIFWETSRIGPPVSIAGSPTNSTRRYSHRSILHALELVQCIRPNMHAVDAQLSKSSHLVRLEDNQIDVFKVNKRRWFLLSLPHRCYEQRTKR